MDDENLNSSDWASDEVDKDTTTVIKVGLLFDLPRTSS